MLLWDIVYFWFDFEKQDKTLFFKKYVSLGWAGVVYQLFLVSVSK